ncbi:hypothetical protein Tco_1146075 [Tanacetum coccineum]
MIEHIVRDFCEAFVDLKLAIRQDLGFIPSGNVVLSSTYVGKILGADQLLVILCYRYQESGIGYWILSMTISGSGFGVSSWRGSRVDGRSYLLSGAIDGSKVNEIIQNPKWELESSCFTFDLVPLVVRSVCIAWMIVESLKDEKMYVKFSNNVKVEHRGSYLDVEGIKWMLYDGIGRRSEAKNEFELDLLQSDQEIESGSYWLDKVRTSIWRDVRTLAIEEAYTTKYSIHPGADTMLCGFRLTNRWLSMKKDIASCGSKYLAYSEVEVEYQGSSGLLLQPELLE